jgi:hypothetical protein
MKHRQTDCLKIPKNVFFIVLFCSTLVQFFIPLQYDHLFTGLQFFT